MYSSREIQKGVPGSCNLKTSSENVDSKFLLPVYKMDSPYLFGTFAIFAPIAVFQEWFPVGYGHTLIMAACSGIASLKSQESRGTNPCRSVLPPLLWGIMAYFKCVTPILNVPCTKMCEKQSLRY